nr:uncharacterized protein LOC109621914 [Aedes albopictus]
MLVVYVLIILDTVLLSIPNHSAEGIIGVPPQFSWIGGPVASIVSFLLVSLLAVGFFPKYLSNVTCVGILLMGMHAKLKIVAYRYDRLLNEPVLNCGQYFTRIDREIRGIFVQQLEYWKHLRILKNVVGKTFFFVHYYAIFSIGTSGYAIQKVGINTLSIVSLASTLIFLLEYYLWCHWIDSLQDVADNIGRTISELCIRMPYSREYHAQYTGLRVSLMITWINTQHAFTMDCLGLFKISTFAFTDWWTLPTRC